MTKCKKIWIAHHSQLPDVFKVSILDKSGEREYLDSYMENIDAEDAPYKEYIIFEVEGTI